MENQLAQLEARIAALEANEVKPNMSHMTKANIFASIRQSFGQQINLGIGTPNPNLRTILELNSTSLVFLPPRMTTTQRNLITPVPQGAVIYNTTSNKLNMYNGSTWEAVTSA